MKKYIQPTTELIFITPTLMQATSKPTIDTGEEEDPGLFEAPRWSFFDDEDDEEENVY